jgi:hypothetical protein
VSARVETLCPVFFHWYHLFFDIVLQKRLIFTPSRSLFWGVGYYTTLILRVNCTTVLLCLRLRSNHDDSFLHFVLYMRYSVSSRVISGVIQPPQPGVGTQCLDWVRQTPSICQLLGAQWLSRLHTCISLPQCEDGIWDYWSLAAVETGFWTGASTKQSYVSAWSGAVAVSACARVSAVPFSIVCAQKPLIFVGNNRAICFGNSFFEVCWLKVSVGGEIADRHTKRKGVWELCPKEVKRHMWHLCPTVLVVLCGETFVGNYAGRPRNYTGRPRNMVQNLAPAWIHRIEMH